MVIEDEEECDLVNQAVRGVGEMRGGAMRGASARRCGAGGRYNGERQALLR